jgi:hypothetical protein
MKKRVPAAALLCAAACSGQPATHDLTLTYHSDSVAEVRFSIPDAQPARLNSCLDPAAVERVALGPGMTAALSSRNIVVANPVGHAFHVFGLDGTLLHSVGKRGSGPGEFVRLDWIGVEDSTVTVYDSGLRRISTFSSGGDLLWTRSMPTGRSADSVAFATVAGSILRHELVLVGTRITVRSAGRHRVPQYIYHWDMSDDDPQLMAELAGSERQLEHLGSEDLAILPPLFPLQSFVAVRAGRIALTDSDQFRVTVLEPDLERTRTLEVNLPALPVTRGRVGAELARIESARRNPMPREVVAALRSRLRDSIPVIAGLHIDPAGTIWTRPVTDETESQIWWVLPTDGRSVRGVVLPEQAQLIDVGDEYIATLEPTQLGGQTVCTYTVR